ncbi:MAG: class I SAM-dependent methyltransferase [Bacillota bacterium]
MNSDIKQWLQEIAIDSLSQLGIKPGMKVLDFGAREGYNTLPVAKIVSSRGEVIAVDEDKKALNNLKKKMLEKSIDNVKIINNKGKADLDIQDNSLDFIILFDVFHELKDSDNQLKEFQRILKNKATKL